MLSFEKFAKLMTANVQQKPMPLRLIGQDGEYLSGWLANLKRLDKHEQYEQIRTVLGELIVADISDACRCEIINRLYYAFEHVIALMHTDYVYAAQNDSPEQQKATDEVKSLYFLMILVNHGIACRSYDEIKVLDKPPTSPQGFLSKWRIKLPINTIKNGLSFNTKDPSELLTLSVYRMMSAFNRLLLEYALCYQKAPNTLWQHMNAWYLKSASLAVDSSCVNRISPNAPQDCIKQQYLQSCLASFANLFAYRRTDINNIFKILPAWEKYVATTFEPSADHKIFVNLKGGTPPEMIGPYASINPFCEDAVCLFLCVDKLFEYLQSITQNALDSSASATANFENRLANLVLIAFKRHSKTIAESTHAPKNASVILGFEHIFNAMSAPKSFAQVIAQSKLPSQYHSKAPPKQLHSEQWPAKVTKYSEQAAYFSFDTKDKDSCPILRTFGLFALKTDGDDGAHPWRIGAIFWVEPNQRTLGIDGHFFGNILSACGVRLQSHDRRDKDFVPALLITGEGLNAQTTIILPYYHFKTGDTIILRIGEKQSTLRLEKQLLSGDSFEQYEVVRLVG